MVEAEKPIVLVTGVNGFLGSHIAKKILDEHPELKIRGCTRSLEPSRLAPLKEAFGEEKFSTMEFAQADLDNSDDLRKAIQGCTYVIHTAHPIPGKVKINVKNILASCENWMNTILSASKEFGVKKIVCTSDLITMIDLARHKREHIQTPYDESGKSNEELLDPFMRGKIKMENAINEFIEREKPEFSVVTINPGFIVGPSVTKSVSSSMGLVKEIMSGKWPSAPKMRSPAVNVLDVVHAHVFSLTNDSIGQPEKVERFALCQTMMYFIEIFTILDDEFKDKGFKIGKKETSYCTLKVISWFEPMVAFLMPFVGVEFEVNNQKSRDVLGIKYDTDFKEVFAQMGYKLIEDGELKIKEKKKK